MVGHSHLLAEKHLRSRFWWCIFRNSNLFLPAFCKIWSDNHTFLQKNTSAPAFDDVLSEITTFSYLIFANYGRTFTPSCRKNTEPRKPSYNMKDRSWTQNSVRRFNVTVIKRYLILLGTLHHFYLVFWLELYSYKYKFACIFDMLSPDWLWFLSIIFFAYDFK